MAKAAKKVASSLLTALRFVNLTQNKGDETYRKHCKLSGRWAVAFDGVLMCGHPIEDDIEAQPRTEMLIKGLEKATDALKITNVDNSLKLVSGSFKLTVPCDPTPLYLVPPDPPMLTVTPALLTALSLVVSLPEETEERTVCRTVLLKHGSAMATRKGHMVTEAWHAIALPFSHALPVRSVKAILAVKKEIAAIGWSETSFTVHFADQSFIKTQVDDGQWPDLSRMFDKGAEYRPIPEGFFEALDMINDFSIDGRIRFRENKLQTHPDENLGSSFECFGVPFPVTYSSEYLYLTEGVIQTADFMRSAGCFWKGEKDGVKVRGAIAKLHEVQ